LALLAALTLSLLAFVDGVYLAMVHIDLELGGGGIGQICHALSETGCTVTGGRFGALAGVPVAVVGAAGALTCALLSLVALLRVRHATEPVRDLLLLMAGGSVLASLLMALLSLVEGKFCPFCVVWYGFNGGLLAAAWFACTSVVAPTRAIGEAVSAGLSAARRAIALLPVLVFGLSLFGLTSAYQWFHDLLVHAEERNATRVIEEVLAKPPRRDIERAILSADLPRRRVGPEGGEAITVIEFSDFQCPYCRRAWQQLEAYAEHTPVPLELIYVHFPLDASCNPLVSHELHPYACLAATASECARREGVFWGYADAIFADQAQLERPALLDRAEALGLDRAAFDDCLEDPGIEQVLLDNITLASRAEVHGTPTLFIGGYRIGGVPRRPTFDRILEKIVADRAKRD
jgi:protein-disulfide isomerase